MSPNSRIRSQLERYSPMLDELETRFGNRLWITGGWARATISPRNYAGDIDCIVFGNEEKFADILKASPFALQRAPLGCLRIMLPDRNHLDIIPASGKSESDAVLHTLAGFNFSANSIAINHATDELLRTTHNVEDADRASFRVNDGYDIGRHQVVLSRDFEIFEKYYRLRSVDTPLMLSLKTLVQSYLASERRGDPAEILARRCEALLPCLPNGAEAWLVRGCVRSALLGQIKYWDDIDVVVNCTHEQIFRHLNDSCIPFSLNMYGSPKAVLHGGLKVDVWALDTKHGMAGELARYSHDLDSIAWSVQEQKLCDPIGVSQHLADRILDINSLFDRTATTLERQYAAMKSLYLIIRHQLTFSERVSVMMKTAIDDPSPFLTKHLIRLMRELCLCVTHDDMDRSLAILESKLQGSDAIKLARQYA